MMSSCIVEVQVVTLGEAVVVAFAGWLRRKIAAHVVMMSSILAVEHLIVAVVHYYYFGNMSYFDVKIEHCFVQHFVTVGIAPVDFDLFDTVPDY